GRACRPSLARHRRARSSPSPAEYRTGSRRQSLVGSAGVTGPMEGIRVVEVGMWVAGPAASAVLGDWGADVIKIEPPDGDPFRGLISSFGGDGSSPPFELDNRNKRSVGLNLAHDDARRIAAQLVDQADVFVTNARLGALERAGLDYATVSARNPRLVYAIITGYGVEGEDRGRAAYDVG